MGTFQRESVNSLCRVLAELGLQIASIAVIVIQSSPGEVWRSSQDTEGETNWATMEFHHIFFAPCMLELCCVFIAFLD